MAQTHMPEAVPHADDQLQVKVMKLLFVDYKTPTMAGMRAAGQRDRTGQEGRAGLVPERSRQGEEVQADHVQDDGCRRGLSQGAGGVQVVQLQVLPQVSPCRTTSSPSATSTTPRAYIQTQSDAERGDHGPGGGVGVATAAVAREMDQTLWEKTSTSTSQQQLAQLQQGLNAAAAFSLFECSA